MDNWKEEFEEKFKYASDMNREDLKDFMDKLIDEIIDRVWFFAPKGIKDEDLEILQNRLKEKFKIKQDEI